MTRLAIILALFALPVHAAKWNAPFLGRCTDTYSDIEAIYGPLTPKFTRVSNAGFGLSLLENERFEVVLIAPAEGVHCIVWDNLLIEGEGA